MCIKGMVDQIGQDVRASGIKFGDGFSSSGWGLLFFYIMWLRGHSFSHLDRLEMPQASWKSLLLIPCEGEYAGTVGFRVRNMCTFVFWGAMAEAQAQSRRDGGTRHARLSIGNALPLVISPSPVSLYCATATRPS